MGPRQSPVVHPKPQETLLMPSTTLFTITISSLHLSILPYYTTVIYKCSRFRAMVQSSELIALGKRFEERRYFEGYRVRIKVLWQLLQRMQR